MFLEKILSLDREATEKIRGLITSRTIKLVAAFIAHSGDSWFWLSGLGLLWLFGSSQWKAFALILTQVILITAGVVFIVKIIVRRKRPDGDWGTVYRKTDPHSFPSGHAARGAAIGVITSVFVPGWIPVAVWIWALLLPVSRVSLGVHFLSDVLAGSLIGLSISFLFLYLTRTIIL